MLHYLILGQTDLDAGKKGLSHLEVQYQSYKPQDTNHTNTYNKMNHQAPALPPQVPSPHQTIPIDKLSLPTPSPRPFPAWPHAQK